MSPPDPFVPLDYMTIFLQTWIYLNHLQLQFLCATMMRVSCYTLDFSIICINLVETVTAVVFTVKTVTAVDFTEAHFFAVCCVCWNTLHTQLYQMVLDQSEVFTLLANTFSIQCLTYCEHTFGFQPTECTETNVGFTFNHTPFFVDNEAFIQSHTKKASPITSSRWQFM